MFLRYIYDEKLAQASYFVACPATGEALVIDPARDITPYTDMAAVNGFTITAAAETHIHADFVSGARQLAENAGATLLVSGEGGPNWQYTYLEDYPHATLQDGDTFNLGNLEFVVMHTPGHTPEHLTFLVRADGDYGLFTGDFVFVGDVGRPDLIEAAGDIDNTAEGMARAMFHALERFKTLPQHLMVMPGHGAGSACGTSLGAVPSSTVGYEKRFNPMLQFTEEDAFVAALLESQTTPPRYFPRMKQVNRDGPKVLGEKDAPEKLPPLVLRNALENGATVIDTRDRFAFAESHLPGTINMELSGGFPNYTGALLDYERPFYAITDDRDTLVRGLRSVGLDNLAGTFPTKVSSTILRTTKFEMTSYANHTPGVVATDVQNGNFFVLDVRSPGEYADGHIDGALNIPLGELPDRLTEIPHDQTVLVHCHTGVRSAIATSILRLNGVDAVNLDGGYVAWTEHDQAAD
jgi:hydroxyacylglutathione hydrolase